MTPASEGKDVSFTFNTYIVLIKTFCKKRNLFTELSGLGSPHWLYVCSWAAHPAREGGGGHWNWLLCGKGLHSGAGVLQQESQVCHREHGTGPGHWQREG